MNTTDTTQALLTSAVYQSLLQHSWLRNDLSGVVDFEQAGHMLRADYELCHYEPIVDTQIATLLSIALNAVEWGAIAKSLMQRWRIPFPQVVAQVSNVDLQIQDMYHFCHDGIVDQTWVVKGALDVNLMAECFAAEFLTSFADAKQSIEPHIQYWYSLGIEK